jgi:hypothetical protein
VTDLAAIWQDSLEHARKLRPWLVQPARAGFIVNRTFHVSAYAKRKADGNPDVAELYEYNWAACRHDSVPGAISDEVLADERKRYALWATATVWEAECIGCHRLVLCEVTP